MQILIWSVAFIVSLAVLVKASDIFVEAAEKIGASLGMPHFIIGVVIVGVGTSLPELVSSVFAVVGGNSEIVVGNVLGSNITNVFLILGIAAVVGGSFRIDYDIMRTDLPIFFGSCMLLALMIYDGAFTMGEALFCLVGLAVYIFSTLAASRQTKEQTQSQPAGTAAWLKLLAGLVLIFLGAKYTVDAVVELSDMLAIGTEVIALSAVSLGTSLPEVLVTISAARKGKPEMAIGNIIGSNIFNTFAVMGIPGMIGRLNIPQSVVFFSLPVFIVSTALYVIITVDRRINRWEGSLLLLFYLYFICRLFNTI